jgi:hypothetical protein
VNQSGEFAGTMLQQKMFGESAKRDACETLRARHSTGVDLSPAVATSAAAKQIRR